MSAMKRHHRGGRRVREGGEAQVRLGARGGEQQEEQGPGRGGCKGYGCRGWRGLELGSRVLFLLLRKECLSANPNMKIYVY